MALVLISHDLGMVAEMTERVAVIAIAAASSRTARHRTCSPIRPIPIRAASIAALPRVDGPRQRSDAIPGTVPPPSALPPGCTFSPRCMLADEDCLHCVPPMRSAGVDDRHLAACVHLGAVSSFVPKTSAVVQANAAGVA